MTTQLPFRPIILIGAARSGTKMLRDAIALHPQIDKVPYDINYIWRLGNERLPHDELTPDMATQEVVSRIRKQFTHYHSPNKPLLIEKTVGNTLRPLFVDKVFPEALFIHLIRDGRDVVESVYRQWLAPPDWHYITKKAISFPITQAFGYAMRYAKTTLAKALFPKNHKAGTWGPRYVGIDEDVLTKDLLTVCAIQWQRSIEKALDELDQINESRVFTIRYEKFVDDPRTHLIQLAAFIGVDDSFYSQVNLDHISSKNIGKGFQNLTSDQIDAILDVISPSLQRLEYL
jgi:hypothetical protein